MVLPGGKYQKLSRLTISGSFFFVAPPPNSFLSLLVPCCFFSIPCFFLFLLTGLHRKGIALPEPAEILGNLDKEGEDPDGAPCLRETDAHADFLFHFAKTVIIVVRVQYIQQQQQHHVVV
jgi:hypothetical protein